jgi:hypothetical protein
MLVDHTRGLVKPAQMVACRQITEPQAPVFVRPDTRTAHLPESSHPAIPPHRMTAIGLEDIRYRLLYAVSTSKPAATNSGLISGSAVSCEPDPARHYATLETSHDGR